MSIITEIATFSFALLAVLTNIYASPISAPAATTSFSRMINLSLYDSSTEMETRIQSDFNAFQSTGFQFTQMTNLLVFATMDSYFQQFLGFDDLEKIMLSHTSDITTQIKLFAALHDCKIVNANCIDRSLGYKLTAKLSPNLKWTQNLGFNAQIDEVFLTHDFKKVTSDFARGATADELQWLYDRNLLTTHMLRLVGILSGLETRDNGLCRYALNLLTQLQKRDQTFRLIQADIEPWIGCISPYETESMIRSWHQLVVDNLDLLTVESQKATVESLIMSVKWAIDDNRPTYSIELTHLANIGSRISLMGINDFIQLSSRLLTSANDLTFNVAENPMLMQVLEDNFVTNSMNRHRSHYPLGQLLSLMTPKDLKMHGLESQIEYVIEDRTFNARTLPRPMIQFISTFYRSLKSQFGTEDVALNLCELSVGLPLLSFESLSGQVLTEIIQKCPIIVHMMSETQKLIVANKLSANFVSDSFPVNLVSYLDVSDVQNHTTLVRLQAENFDDQLIQSEIFRQFYSALPISPKLAEQMESAILGLDFKKLDGLSLVDQIDVLRIFGDRKVHFSRSEAHTVAKIFRENFKKLNILPEFSVQLLPGQDFYFMPPEMFLEFEESELENIDKLACQNIFHRVTDDYLLKLPTSRLRMLASVYIENCKRESEKRSHEPLAQKDVDNLRHLVCYAPKQIIEDMSYEMLSNALIYFSKCSIDDAIASLISEKLHFVFITPKKVEDLGINFCSVFSFDVDSVQRLEKQKQHYLSAFLKVLDEISRKESLTDNLLDCTRTVSSLVTQTIKANTFSGLSSLCETDSARFLTCPVIRSLGWANQFTDSSYYKKFSSKCDLERCSGYIKNNQKFFTEESLTEIAFIIFPPDSEITHEQIISSAFLLPFTNISVKKIVTLAVDHNERNYEVIETLGKVQNLELDQQQFSRILSKIGRLNFWKVSLIGEIICNLPVDGNSNLIKSYFESVDDLKQSIPIIGQLKNCSDKFFASFANQAVDLFRFPTISGLSPFVISKLGNLVPYLNPYWLTSLDDSALQAINPEVLNKLNFDQVIEPVLERLSVDQISELSEELTNQMTPEQLAYVHKLMNGLAETNHFSESTTEESNVLENSATENIDGYDYYSQTNVRVIYIYSSANKLVSDLTLICISIMAAFVISFM
ncbi:uncharacterized protein LOC142344648 [Convolutriloba macropyga]|uniref:uncharacterized protein LOC142344648 n=1 Tax=Convolutriloba macropyga TaxID=536237 RepID=UPI003F51F177